MTLRPYLALSVTLALASSLVPVACSNSPSSPSTMGGAGKPAAGGAGAATGGSTATGGAQSAGTSAGGASVTGGAGGASGMASGGSATGGVAAGGSATGGAPGAFAWPDGKTAAVSLTYDDGLDGQLAHAIPLLDSKGIKATFFISSFPGVDHDWALPSSTSQLNARQQAWLAVAGKGHEIAGHTVNHPCVTAINPGQSPGFLLDKDYTMTRIKAELDDSLLRLVRIGATAPITFAYPCYSDAIGVGASTGAMATVLGKQMPQGEVFTAEVSSRFMASRGSTEAIANPATVDLHSVPHIVTGPRTTTDTTPTLAQMTAIVDMAIAQHGWVVFLFHGVAGDTLPTKCDNGLTYAPATCVIDYLDTPTAVHDGLVEYLASKPAVWTTTFKTVAQHVKTQRGL